jgi:hypothetical protein
MIANKNTKDAFLWIVKIFQKNKIPFQLTGGFAAKIYGSPGEKNEDLDFDIPDNSLEEISQKVSKYIVFGAKRFIGESFDALLLRLNYKGQQIDISGGDSSKMLDKKSGKWVKDPTDFGRYEMKKVFGINVPVIKSDDLLAYKRKLLRKVDLVDIKAIE